MSVDVDKGIGVRASFEVLLGQLSQTMGQVSETMTKLHKFLTPNPRISPIVRPIRGTVVSDGSTYVYINLGGPASGRYWDLRRLSVLRTTLAAGGFADALTQPASVIAVVVIMASRVPNAGTANLTAFDDLVSSASAANTPLSLVWSAHEVTIRTNQNLVVAIKGTTSSDQYLASGQAEEYIESLPETVVA